MSKNGIEIRGASGRLCEFLTITGNEVRVTGATGCIYLNANGGTIQRGAITGNSTFGGSHGVVGSVTGVDKIACVGNVLSGASTEATANLGAASTIANNQTT